MLLGVYKKDGSMPGDECSVAIADFSLGGKRAVSIERCGGLLCATTSGPPFPPFAKDPDADGRRIVCASGAAYNLQSSLAEDLLASHVKYGAGMTPPRNGSFAFVAYDSSTNELLLGNDAFGFHPLCVLETESIIAFCNEFEPLRHLLPDGARLDPDAVAQFFVYGSTLGTKTFLKGVNNLEPGTILTARDGRLSSRCHDSLDIKVAYGRTLEEYADEVGEAFQRAVHRRMDEYTETRASLTGGADTRLNLSCMSQTHRQRTHFVTHYVEEGAADLDRDVVIARKLAEKAGLRHEAQFQNGAANPFSPAVFQSLREREAHPDHIHGVWGGEYLGGCAVDVALFPVERVTQAAVENKARRVLSPEFLGRTSCLYDALKSEYRGIQAENREFLFWIQMFSRPFFTRLYTGSGGLSSNTWMTPWLMCLRLNSPFQDADFLRTLLAVPFEYVTGYRLYNGIYARCFPELTDVPTNSGLAMRSDSTLKMYVEGEEPKQRRRAPAADARRDAFAALDSAGGVWGRGIFATEQVRRKCEAETALRDKPSLSMRLKDRYTSSILFRVRHRLPLHGMLMRIKSRGELSHGANLEAPLTGSLVDFEYWCQYAGL